MDHQAEPEVYDACRSQCSVECRTSCFAKQCSPTLRFPRDCSLCSLLLRLSKAQQDTSLLRSTSSLHAEEPMSIASMSVFHANGL
jgi:hypothetical protein